MRPLAKRRLLVIGLALLALAILPGYIRAFVILGDSDAPAFITGDRVVVNQAAYDLRLPYSDQGLLRLADPKPGDVVLIRLESGELVVKRVVAGPGTRVALRDNHLILDGRLLEYSTEASQSGNAIDRGSLGPVMELERGNGPEVYVSFGENGPHKDFGERAVPQGHYFVLGSNRDVSLDSRQLGPFRRDRILGKVIWRFPGGG